MGLGPDRLAGVAVEAVQATGVGQDEDPIAHDHG